MWDCCLFKYEYESLETREPFPSLLYSRHIDAVITLTFVTKSAPLGK